MIWRMIRQSWRRDPRRKALAIITVALAACLLSALMAVSIDIGDKMAREMKSYGANILIEPAEQTVLPGLFGDGEDNPPARRSSLNETELPNIIDIFWRNNIVGFAPILFADVEIAHEKTRTIGTFFDAPFPTADDPEFHTGQKIISSYWHIQGTWPKDGKAEVLAGEQLARKRGWKQGAQILTPSGTVTLTGILSVGGEEDDALIAPLALVQSWSAMKGKIHLVRVSALTVPENDLSRKAVQNPGALDAETYDLWYCTAYVTSIAHQLEEAVSGSIVRPIWQVAASEGAVIGKLQWLLAMAACASLLASAMGIASLMTSVLIERAKEIGLMKALGARDWQISLPFYAEAVLSSLVGGVLGCMAGWTVARAIGRQLFGIPLDFAWVVLPVTLAIAVVIALIGTWFPARRIASLYPVEVLHGRD